jgi:hypothetical protein
MLPWLFLIPDDEWISPQQFEPIVSSISTCIPVYKIVPVGVPVGTGKNVMAEILSHHNIASSSITWIFKSPALLAVYVYIRQLL